MDEIDDMDVSMESDMERLLAVTNVEDDASPRPPVPEVVPEALLLRAPAPLSPPLSLDNHSLHSSDVPASQASTAFLREVVTLVDNNSVNELKALQLQTCVCPDSAPSPGTQLTRKRHLPGVRLNNLHESTTLLTQFNAFSGAHYAPAADSLAKSARLVQGITADLHHIFKRTRALQRRIQEAVPEAWATVGPRPRFGEDDD
jgi:hypothetical protein